MNPLDLLVTNDLLRGLDLLGVFIMGVAAGALAARLKFDAVGFAIIGIVAALGGGLLRDLIIGVKIPAAFDGPSYLACALLGAGFSYLITAEGAWWQRTVTMLDIAAMSLWAATGTAKSIGFGLEPLPAILLGVTSGVGGGVIRDVLVGRIPAIFGGGPLYATGALVTAVGTWGVVALGLRSPFVLIAVALGALLAVLAAWRRWQLPAHGEWQVTLSASQMKSLVRRVRKDERHRVALQTGAIPVVDESTDDLADDVAISEDDPEEYERRILGEDASTRETDDEEYTAREGQSGERTGDREASSDDGADPDVPDVPRTRWPAQDAPGHGPLSPEQESAADHDGDHDPRGPLGTR